jgi:prephenate dehydrogenase
MVSGLADTRVTIAGLGLMGASLAGALKGRCQSITGVARRAETIQAAMDTGLVDWGTTDLVAGVRSADIVVLATPVRVIIHQLREIAPHLPPGCLVMDMGSTKAEIVAEMERLPRHVQPLGGHPMCGKEVSGIEASDPALYQGCTFILCPLPRTSEAALALGVELAEATGAHTLVLEAVRQDFLVGTVSHLPYLLACGLVGTADATTSADPAAWKIVAGGFRDTSRVSGSEVSMMVDILLTNQSEVLKAVDSFQEQLTALARLIEAGDEENLRAALTSIRQTRLEMFP